MGQTTIELSHSDWLVCSGSLPPGWEDRYYTRNYSGDEGHKEEEVQGEVAKAGPERGSNLPQVTRLGSS